MKTFKTAGRIYNVLVTFKENEVSEANAYMTENANAAVLAVEDGLIIIADFSDIGAKS